MRTPNRIRAPTPQVQIHGSLRGNGRSLKIPGGTFSFGNCLAHPAPALSSRSAPCHAHTLTLPVPRKAPPPARPEARAGAAPPRSRPRLHKLVCPWPAGKKTLAAVRTGVRAEAPRRQDSPATAAGRGARFGGHAPASPGRRARSPAVPGAERPQRPQAPGRPRGKRPDAARTQDAAARLPGAADVRAEPRRHSSRARSRRLAGGGRRASGRPALHMLTRAVRGQRPAAAGS